MWSRLWHDIDIQSITQIKSHDLFFSNWSKPIPKYGFSISSEFESSFSYFPPSLPRFYITIAFIYTHVYNIYTEREEGRELLSLSIILYMDYDDIHIQLYIWVTVYIYN